MRPLCRHVAQASQAELHYSWVEHFARLSYIHLFSLESHVGPHLYWVYWPSGGWHSQLTCQLIASKTWCEGKISSSAVAWANSAETFTNVSVCVCWKGVLKWWKCTAKEKPCFFHSVAWHSAPHKHERNEDQGDQIKLESTFSRMAYLDVTIITIKVTIKVYLCRIFGEHSPSWDLRPWQSPPQLLWSLRTKRCTWRAPDDRPQRIYGLHMEGSLTHTSKGGWHSQVHDFLNPKSGYHLHSNHENKEPEETRHARHGTYVTGKSTGYAATFCGMKWKDPQVHRWQDASHYKDL